MASQTSIPMLFGSDVRMIPMDKVDAAKGAGGKVAQKIIGPDKSMRWIPAEIGQQAYKAGWRPVPLDTETASMQGSPVVRFFSSAGNALKGAVQGLDPRPTDQEKTEGLTTPYDYVMRPFERVAEGGIQQAQQAASAFKGSAPLALHPTFQQLQQRQLALGHALAAAIPAVGPWAAGVGEQLGTQIGKGNYAGAAGTMVGNAALAATPEVAGKTLDLARDRVANIGSAPRAVADLVKKTEADNAAIREANKTGIHAAKGREIAYQHEVAGKAEEVAGEERLEASKLQLKHEKELREAREHNANVRAKHAAVSKRIQEENAAQENMLNLRRQKESDLQASTDAYRAQEEATDTGAKARENEKWNAWRSKMKDATIDGAEISAPLGKLRLDSPEVDRTLNQLEPRGDEVPQESPYYRLRDHTSIQNVGKPYADLSPLQQDVIDRAMAAHGESPDPIALDPRDGQPISVERVQRANSILQRYIRSGRFEGPLLGEMKQVSKVLRRAVTNASDEHGALGDLEAARAETVRYQEAFGRERPEPRTVRGEREKTANPEEVKRLQEEERLEAARQYDPSLAEAQEKVRAAREELKKLPSEDQLRKARKQVPAAPSVNHPYEAYRLKPEPSEPPKRLTSGSPLERASRSVIPPDRFLETPEKKIGGEDVEKLKEHRAAAAAAHVRHWGTYLGFVWPAIEVIRTATRGEMPNIASTAASMIATPLAADAVARIIESPKMAHLLTRATPGEIAQIPESLRGDLPSIVQAAEKKGIAVSSAMKAAVATGASSAQSRNRIVLPAGHPLSQSPVQ